MDLLNHPLLLPQPKFMLLRLPDDLILRVLRALMCDQQTQKAPNLRDAWNVATTCKRLNALVSQVSSSLRATAVHMQQGVPYDIVRAVCMPDDVVRGAFMALRAGGPALRAVHLSPMRRAQLQHALALLRRCPSLTELSFVDAKKGVIVPNEVASRLQTLTIVSPQRSTLRSLYTAKCTPKQLKLLNFDEHDGRADMLHQVWPVLTRECTSVDLTQVNCEVDVWQPPFTEAQLERMKIRARSGEAPFEVLHTLCMRVDGAEGGRYAANTTVVSEWITTVQIPRPEIDNGALVVLHCECEDDKTDENSDDDSHDDGAPYSESLRWRCGSLSEISSAHDFLHRNEGAMVREFVDQMLGPNGIDTLLVTTAPATHCSAATAWVAALSAARLAAEAGNVRVLAVSAPVFVVLRDVRLPKCVRNVCVVDRYVTAAFVHALPAVLWTLARQEAVRSVCVGDIPLRDLSCKQSALRRALSACRYAEAAGLCAAGVRGKVERWLRARTR